MVRNLRSLACMTIAFVALAGTATAGASLLGSLDASATSDDASAYVAGDATATVDDDGNVDVDAAADANAYVRGHDADVSADADGNVAATAGDHGASASVDAHDQSATVTVDGRTVSTDEVSTDVGDLPDVPEVDGSVSFDAMLDVMVDACEQITASLHATLTAILGF